MLVACLTKSSLCELNVTAVMHYHMLSYTVHDSKPEGLAKNKQCTPAPGSIPFSGTKQRSLHPHIHSAPQSSSDEHFPALFACRPIHEQTVCNFRPCLYAEANTQADCGVHSFVRS